MSNASNPNHLQPQSTADAHREAIFRVMAYHVGPRAAQAILDRANAARTQEASEGSAMPAPGTRPPQQAAAEAER